MPEPVLEVRDLSVTYPPRTRGGQPVRAVDLATLSLAPGEAIGLVGESGCGKTSLARALVGLEAATGEILLRGERLGPHRTHDQARRVQMVFQDPFASLNPRLTVRDALGEMIRVHRLREPGEVPARVRELVDTVGLPERVLDVRPARLSGGQRQRVAIARALALEPDVLVADEPTTALDVSVQAVILELFTELRERLGLSLLLITHNIGVVGAICDRIAVMYLGRIAEVAPTATLLADARHPYTRRLLSAVPRLAGGPSGGSAGGLPALAGDPPDPANLPSGCAFHPRCPLAAERCRTDAPALSAGRGDPAARHSAACHFAWSDATGGPGRTAPSAAT
jgi:oligopeptide/dipeptide ABC transporter ATP-binding protein